MKLQGTIKIKSPTEKVFCWLEDPQRAMEWMTSVKKTEIIKRTSEMIGTTFREYIEENGRGTEMRGVVTEFIPNKRIAFYLSGDFNSVKVDFSLEESEGITLLTQTAIVNFKGMLKVFSILFGIYFKRKISHQIQHEFTRLKELCERSTE